VSLQFYPSTDYFLVMRQIGSSWRNAGLPSSRAALTVATAVVLGTACEDRERLTFPTPADGIGPVTTIDRPNGADTTIFPGPEFMVQGTTVDPDGVDTVYFFVTGGNQSHLPFSPNPTQTTVRFGIPLTTFGRSGETFVVEVYGVDVVGNRGRTSTRLIHVQ
jgi:hypothetical protein